MGTLFPWNPPPATITHEVISLRPHHTELVPNTQQSFASIYLQCLDIYPHVNVAHELSLRLECSFLWIFRQKCRQPHQYASQVVSTGPPRPLKAILRHDWRETCQYSAICHVFHKIGQRCWAACSQTESLACWLWIYSARYRRAYLFGMSREKSWKECQSSAFTCQNRF